MSRPVRRVVTGHDADGKSIVLYDGIAQSILANPDRPDRPGRGLTDLRVTDAAPAAPAALVGVLVAAEPV